MKYTKSKALQTLLDEEIERFEQEETEESKEKQERERKKQQEAAEYEKIIADEIADLESRFDELNEDYKEYLDWLKGE